MTVAQAMRFYRKYLRISALCLDEMNDPGVKKQLAEAVDVLGVLPDELDHDCVQALRAYLNELHQDQCTDIPSRPATLADVRRVEIHIRELAANIVKIFGPGALEAGGPR